MKLHSHFERLVNQVARKKIVFIIVEGPSDDTALGLLFNRFYQNKQVYIQILHRDITTENGVNPSNIISSVCNEIKTYAKANHLNSSHFHEIIHITDTDGAFINNQSIIEDDTIANICYSETEIRTPNKSNIESRNQQKSANLTKLSSCSQIWGIPYHIFYMSCNLDHVLYNKLNSSDEEKENDAFLFAKQYKDNIPGFTAFISQSDFSVPGSYSDTWKYIKEDLHSLERHTNLGLCFLQEENGENPS